MFHVGIRPQPKKGIDYGNLHKPEEKQTIQVPEDESVPEAPDGFLFYRIKSGDTLVSLSVRFGISQNKIRRYNNKVCFGHRLTHIIGKLLLIPTESTANLTTEIREQLQQIYTEDAEEQAKHDENIDDRKYPEPDENGKYQLKKALMFHAKDIDEHRAAYYLGEANWNVRKALNLWRDDDKWDKRRQVMNACQLSEDEASQLLDNYHWDVREVIRFWQKEQKKMEKINKKLEKLQKKTLGDGQETNDEGKGTGRTTEMFNIKKTNTEMKQTLIDPNDDDKDNEDEYDNRNQGSLTAGFCCT